jgi:hypothetical protein
MGASGWGGISSVYTATGTHRTGGFALGAVSSPACAAGAGRALQIDPREATRHVQDYNAGSYRGCGNIFLDAEAYRRFTEGLSREFAELVDQIAFVGERYGGAQERFVDTREEAKLIVSRLLPVLDEWLAVVAAAKPLTQEIPDKATLDFLFFPFEGTKQWPVWASKTLHFLRPDILPILDSEAKKPLGLTSLANSGRGYYEFCSVFRGAMLESSENLAAARVADHGASPTDLKLLDKVLFQIGLRMR